jgi:hypothetical protein
MKTPRSISPQGGGQANRLCDCILISRLLLEAICVVGLMAIGVNAQSSPSKTALPSAPSSPASSAANGLPPRPGPVCCGYNFPRALDAEIADSDVHRILYQDDRIMFMEVNNPPALDVHMHGHPYASVFAHDSTTGAKAGPQPAYASGPTRLDPNSPYNNMGSSDAPAPEGMQWPTCTDSAPQAPHRPYNANVAPNHFYRLEFLRLDGEDLQTRWKEWYPEMTQPEKPVKDLVPGTALGPNFSEQWPYPIVYDSIQAAPNNYKLLFEDAKMRLLEVTIRPGETTPMHGSPYPSVLAFNVINNASDMSDKKLNPASPLNGQGSGRAGPPTVYNLKVPTCMTTAPRAPHAIHNGGTAPLHYYQIEYKRIDGDGLTDNWRKWYPWMQYMQFMRWR